MSINVKKKTIKIVIAIVIMIAVIIIGIVIAKNIMRNNKIDEIEKNISQINAEELKEKIIEKLESSVLNINKQNGEVTVVTMIKEGVQFEDYISASIVCFDNTEVIDAIEIPCFKIKSDSDGKFESIEFVDNVFGGSSVISKAVIEVLREEYNVEYYDNSFTSNFIDYSDRDEGNIYCSNQDFFAVVYEEITNNEYQNGMAKTLNQYNTQTIKIK